LDQSFNKLPKNSVYLGIFTLNYARLFPRENVAYTLSIGLNYFGEFYDGFDLNDGLDGGIVIESTAILFGTKHGFEPGILFYQDFDNSWPIPYIRANYRYQSDSGFMFRIGLLAGYYDGFSVLPATSIGFSF